MRFKKIICILSLSLVVVMLGSFVAPPVHASFLPGSSSNIVEFIGVDIASWIINEGFDLANFIKSLYDDSVCELSGNGKHEFVAKNIDGHNAQEYYVCKYCGQTGEKVFQESYDTYVTDTVEPNLGTTKVGLNGLILPVYVSCNVKDAVGTPGYNFVFSLTWSPSYGAHNSLDLSCSASAPVDGVYTFNGNISYVECSHNSTFYGDNLEIGSRLSVSSGSSLVGIFYITVDRDGVGVVSGSFWYDVVPLSYYVNDYTSSVGGEFSRTGSIYGDYGIIGDNGTINKVENNYIFDEHNNNYYNPCTDNSSTVTEWMYDYSDRSYNLTLENGDTVTVTYGDENITIQEGDQVYNVYYIIQVDADDLCTDGQAHDWQVTDSIPATCTLAGSETKTCSKCGETKTTQLPALGHKWKVLRTVQTKYDESGQLIQEGYTLYECERCGEQYKQDASSTGPPGGGQSGDQGGGSGGGQSGGDISFWDSVVDFFKSIAASFTSLPDWFSRFSEFLSSAFSYLPSDIVLLLTFGVFAVVAIGIWKAARR